MTRYVVLLRGINVGKAKRIAMADLRTLLADLGFTDVTTVLQSGNAVVTGPDADPDEHGRRPGRDRRPLRHGRPVPRAHR